MADFTRTSNGLDRREFLATATLASAGSLLFGTLSAAENRNMKEGVEYMANLAREAGFDTATVVPTDGHPGVFATMDNGAKRTLALYFMYDVKQFDPAE